MTTVAKDLDRAVPAGLASPPPMPSIRASALLESRLLLELTRRTVAAWLTRV